MTNIAMTKDAKRNLPADWRWVRLGEVCEFTYGESMPAHSRASDGPVPVYGSNGIVGRHSQAITNGPTIIIGRKGSIGEVHLSLVGCWPIDTTYYIEHPKIECDLFWLFNCLKTLGLSALNKAAAVPGLNRADAYSLFVPLPPLSEQRRITGMLREQMAAVEKARAAAKERLAAAEALHAAYLRKVFDAPQASNWESRRLGDILIRHNDIIHPGDRASGTAQFVGLEHIEPYTGRRLGSLTLNLAQLTGRKPTFRRGQIVYGYLRPYLNKVWIAEFDGCCSVDQFAFAVRSDVADVEFVAWFMRSPTYLRRSSIMTTTGQLPRIGTEEIAAVEIGLPPLDQQRVIAREINHWFTERQRLCDLIQAEATAIDALPAAFLRRAFGAGL